MPCSVTPASSRYNVSSWFRRSRCRKPASVKCRVSLLRGRSAGQPIGERVESLPESEGTNG